MSLGRRAQAEMSRTHVWLLHRGAPHDQPGVLGMLRALAAQRGRLPLWLAWSGPLGAWLWGRWWAGRLLPGPDPSREHAEIQARKLGALLGERYAVRAVFGFGEDGIEGAGAHLGPRERVIVVDMAPCGGALARARLARTTAEIERRGALPLLGGPLHADPGYLEAVAETLRAAIADLPRGARYELALVGLDLCPPAREEDAYTVVSAAATLAGELRLSVPARTSFLPGPSPRSGTARAALREALGRAPEALIVAPLNVTCEGSAGLAELERLLDELRARAPQVTVLRAATPGARPTFVRALAAVVERAEAEKV